MVEELSTVLEQDHFCSDFLVSHRTVLTNSQYHEDELSCGSAGKRRPVLCLRTKGCDVDEHQFNRDHKGLSDDGGKFFEFFWFEDPSESAIPSKYST